jgi:NTE family protein
MFGGMYAAFQDINAVKQAWEGFGYWELFLTLTDPNIRRGLLKGDKVVAFLQSALKQQYNIEELPIPFTAVATDTTTGNPYLFTSGDLSFAMRASISLPFLIEPLHIEEKRLIDGGASLPVPVEVVRAMGADIVIAVNLDAAYFDKTDVKEKNILTNMKATIDLFRYHLAMQLCRSADVVLDPQIPPGHILDMANGSQYSAIGEQVTEAMIPFIKKLL